MIPDNFMWFMLLTTLVSLAPGPNTMFIMSQAALRGPRAGMMAGIGIQIANVFYFALTALGLASIIATSEVAFSVLKWVGAGYLAAIGLLAFWRSFRSNGGLEQHPPPVMAVHHGGALRDGLMIGLGNPKTIIWFVALLPQFINTERDVLGQTLAIGVVGTVIDLAVQWLYTHLGGVIARFLAKPAIRSWFERGVGTVFVALAIVVILYKKS